jgi:CHAT domain-containing protein
LAYLNIFDPYSLLALLKGNEVDLAAAILRYKGVVLDSVIEDRLLAEANSAGAQENWVGQLNADRKQLDRLLLLAPQKLSAEASRRTDELEREVEQLEGQLAQNVAGMGQARRALGVTPEQVQARLPGDAALVEYLRYRHYLGKGEFEPWYGALVLLTQGKPRWILLGQAKKVDKLVERYTALTGGGGDENELGATLGALYQALWAPLEAALPEDIRRLIVSPDGQLNFVSLATLLTPQGHFLGEKFTVQYVVSGRDLLREHQPAANRNVVLFAAPDFDAKAAARLAQSGDRSTAQSPTRWRGTEKRGLAGLQLEPLLGTRAESERLLGLFEAWHWHTESRLGEQATKAALVKVQSPYILHLATHGFFEPQRPAAEATEAVGQTQNIFQSKFFANPMHQSGLVLAGANVTLSRWSRGQEAVSLDDDGILTAEDVSTLDLNGTWLVTLSACKTGQGEAQAGEGVMGLRRGFVQAVAENLLMTLWSISDETTVQIMSDFYEAAHQSGNAALALAEVQREWLVKLRKEKGLAQAVKLAGPFITSSQGKP